MLGNKEKLLKFSKISISSLSSPRLKISSRSAPIEASHLKILLQSITYVQKIAPKRNGWITNHSLSYLHCICIIFTVFVRPTVWNTHGKTISHTVGFVVA